MSLQRLARVSVLRKVSVLEQLRGIGSSFDAEGVSRMRAQRDELVAQAHESHTESFGRVMSFLKDNEIETRVFDDLSHADVEWADLVISVGGDGTFMRATHAISSRQKTPILGINSNPESSFGFYCAANRDTFPEVFNRLRSGALQCRPLWRMQIFLNEVPFETLVLNDVLFAARGAAATSYYEVTFEGDTQVQKSSGIWISTSAGSTAAILSAGGCVQPLSSRHLQFRVREIFPPSVTSGVPIVAGLFLDGLQIRPRMTNSLLYLDGSNVRLEVGYNDSLQFRPSEKPLQWVSSHFCDVHRRDLRTNLARFKHNQNVAIQAFDAHKKKLFDNVMA